MFVTQGLEEGVEVFLTFDGEHHEGSAGAVFKIVLGCGGFAFRRARTG